MRERRAADEGGLRVERHVHELGDVVGHRRESFEAVARDRLDPHLQREVGDDRREVAVPGAFAVPVDRPLHLHRATEHAGERVRDPTTGVVVQVHPDRGVDVLDDRTDRVFDLVRERTAVGVAQHEAVGARERRSLEHPEAELGVRPVAVEEVLGIEEHGEAVGLEVLDRIGDHRDTFVERGLERFEHVVVPALPDDADGVGAGLDEVAQRVVGVDLALRSARRTERHESARREGELARRTTEELVVLRIGPGPTGLDVVDAEPVELLRDPQLVVDRERDPLELSAVTQRRVVNFYLSGKVRHWRTPASPCSGLPHRARWRSRSPGSCG